MKKSIIIVGAIALIALGTALAIGRINTSGVPPISVAKVLTDGTVTDLDSGSPLSGVTVKIKGTKTSVKTGKDGRYSINVKVGQVLVFSLEGYEDHEEKIVSNTATIDVKLAALVELIEIEPVKEVVIVDDHCADVAYSVSADRREKLASSEVSMKRVVAPPPAHYYDYSQSHSQSEEYNSYNENGFLRSWDVPLSTFSIDVDAASYSNMRRFLNQGQMPTPDAIRTEELVNYFSYDYGKPTGNDPVKFDAEVGQCPWNEKHKLVRIGVKAREVATEDMTASNLVFLIDVSGSMYGPTRLELVKSSLKLLVNNLREQDRVAIVVYAGAAGEVLPSTSGADKQKIREALDRLTAGGSTAGGAGLELAYRVARQNFIKGGNNRIIMCSDGDFNVGVSSNEGLEGIVERNRKDGVFLSLLGYGMGNYKDSKMQVLAEKGNGNHAYIDNLQEANKVLVHEFGGTMYAVAKDVKLQIEFNPLKVEAYRLIGYESRLLKDEDFNDDTKDAGEMGAGHTVTALYEIVPVGAKSNYSGSVDELKYQKPEKPRKTTMQHSPELLTIKLRYKEPDADVSKKLELPVLDRGASRGSQDFNFASAVAMYGQLLTNSRYKADASYDKVIRIAKANLGEDPNGYRREFVRLVEVAKGLDSNNRD